MMTKNGAVEGATLRSEPSAAQIQARVAALHAMAVLDTPREEAFDALTRLAANACDMPIAIVSLIDGDRLWFKAISGLTATTIPSENSFCCQAANSKSLLNVPDARRDPRFAGIELVAGKLQIQSYIGVPIVYQGVGIGTVCVLDYVPRELGARTLNQLADLATVATALLTARVEAFHLFASSKE